MKIPLLPYPTNTYFRVFLMASLIASFAAVIAVKMNEYINEMKKKCLKNNIKHVYCDLVVNNYLSNSGLFLTTFISTIILYYIFYIMFGYGESSIV